MAYLSSTHRRRRLTAKGSENKPRPTTPRRRQREESPRRVPDQQEGDQESTRSIRRPVRSAEVSEKTRRRRRRRMRNPHHPGPRHLRLLALRRVHARDEDGYRRRRATDRDAHEESRAATRGAEGDRRRRPGRREGQGRTKTARSWRKVARADHRTGGVSECVVKSIADLVLDPPMNAKATAFSGRSSQDQLSAPRRTRPVGPAQGGRTRSSSLGVSAARIGAGAPAAPGAAQVARCLVQTGRVVIEAALARNEPARRAVWAGTAAWGLKRLSPCDMITTADSSQTLGFCWHRSSRRP